MRGNGDIPRTLEIFWLILVVLLVDDYLKIVQHTQILIILPYVGIIEPNS